MKKYLKYVLTFVILIFIYLTALTITSLIPRNYIEDNVKKSADTLLKLGEKTTIKTFLKEETLFNFTDSLMINTAYSIDTSNPIEAYMTAKRNYLPLYTTKVYKDTNPPSEQTKEDEGTYKANTYQTEELYSTVNKEVLESYEYARYWHGYLAILRPLLVIMDYNMIQIASLITCIILICVLLYLLYNKVNIITAMVFGIAILSINLPIVSISINAIPVFYIAIIYAIYLLLKFEKIKNIELQFFIIGSITCFIDLLTTPIVAFAIPILVYFILLQKSKKNTVKQLILDYIKISIAWIAGFSITWIIKWILVDVLFNRNVIMTSIKQFLFRVGNDADELAKYYTIGNSLKTNILYFGIRAIEVSFILFFIGILPVIKYKEKISKENITHTLPYIITATIPLVWFSVLKNHSVHHPFFTNRNTIILVLGLEIAIATMFNLLPTKNEQEGEEK